MPPHEGRSAAARGPTLRVGSHKAGGCPPPAVLARLEKATAALVDRAADPTQPSRRLFAGVNASLQRGRPADGGFGVLALQEHIPARQAQWAVRFVMARAVGEQPGLDEGCPGVLHGGIGSLPSSQGANTLHHMPGDSAERKTNTPDRHRQPNRCRTNRKADLPRQSERLRDRERETAVLQRQRHGTADAADPDWCPTAGQNSDAESEHGCVEGYVAIRSRRRCSTLTERRHTARASSAWAHPLPDLVSRFV